MADTVDEELGRVVEAIAAQTRALHLGQHLASRFWQAVSPLGAAGTPRRRVLAAAFAVADIGTSRWITGRRQQHFAARIAVDLLDQAVWSALANDEPESSRCAIIPGAALSSELGARFQWRSLALPAAHAVVAGVVRSRRGHRLRIGQVGWQLWGVFGAIGLSRLGKWRRRRARVRHLDDLAPALVAAEIAGMNDVGVVADNLLDTAQRATILIELSLGARGAFTGALDAGAIKQEMAALTRHVGGYLGDVVTGWQRVRNANADLRLAVRFDIDTGAATLVVTPAQVDTITRFLDRANPRGRVTVRTQDDHLVVGSHRLLLDGVVEVPSLFFDPMPIALVMNAAWIAATTGPARDHVRWTHVGAPVAIALGQAARTARSLRRHDSDRADRSTSVIASGVALGIAATTSARGARSLYTDTGVQRYPFTQALQGYLMVLRIAEPDLTRSGRVAAWSWGAVALGIGLLASPRPRSTRHLLAELVWPLTTAASSAALVASIEGDSGNIRNELLADEQERLAAARRRGSDRMLALVEASIAAAAASLELRRDQLDDDIATEAARRIEHAQASLAEVHGAAS